MNLIQRVEWRLYKEWKRARLKNRTPTILCSNCNGEMISYDMKLRFLTPTINLSMDTDDFIRFLERLPFYLEQTFVPLLDTGYPFPCGLLYDIPVRFNHYDSYEQAVQKWEERKRRIQWDNLYIFGIDGDKASYDSLLRFDSLPFPNKVIFTHRPYPEIPSTYYIRGFEQKECVDVLLYFKKQFLIRRYLDEFDYVAFLNGVPLSRIKERTKS